MPKKAHRFARNSVLSLAICAGSPYLAFGAPVQWITDANGAWTSSANWSSNPSLPGIADDVTISRPSGDWLITLGAGSQSIRSLTSDERLRIVGALSVQTTATINNTLTLAGGTLTGGSWTFAPGTFVAGTSGLIHSTTINGDIAFNNAFSNMTFGNGLVLNGIASLNGSGSYVALSGNRTLSSGTVVFNSITSDERTGIEAFMPGTAFTLGSGATVRGGHGDIGGTLANDTDLNEFVNNGMVSADRAGASLGIKSTLFTNNATVQAVSGGVLEIAPVDSFINTGTVRAASGSTVRIVRTSGQSWSNAGLIAVDGGTVELNGNYTRSELGGISATTGLLDMQGTLTNTGSSLNLGAASLKLSNGSVIGGTVTAATLLCGANTGLLDGVTVNGDIDMSSVGSQLRISNGLVLTGTTSIGRTAALISDTTQTYSSGTYRFVATQAEGRISTKAGTLTFGAGTVIEVANGHLGMIWSDSSGNGSLALKGLVQARDPGSRLSIIPKSGFSEGTIEAINGGRVTIGQAGTSNTTIWEHRGLIRLVNGTIDLGGVFTFGPGASILQQGTSRLNLVGTFSNAGNTTVFNADTGSWLAEGGTLQGGTYTFLQGNGIKFPLSASTAQSGQLTLDNVTINGDMLVQGPGKLSLKGTLGLNGEIVLAGAQNTISCIADTTIQGGSLRFANTSVNSASPLTIVQGQTLTLSPSTVVSGGGGTIRGDGLGIGTLVNLGEIIADVDGARLTVAPGALQNHGSLMAAGGGELVVQSALPWTNSGSIIADNGDVAIGGDVTFAPGSTFSAVNSGTITLSGRLDNTGRTLNLNSAARSLRLGQSAAGADAQIVGGVINVSGGGTLSIPRDGSAMLNTGTLRAVTLNGNMSLEQNTSLRVLDSLVLNGTITLKDTTTSSSGTSTPGGTVSLGGAGTLRFEGTPAELTSFQSQFFTIPAAATTIIEPGFTVSGGGRGSIGSGSRFGGTYALSQPSTLINRGVVHADLPGQFLHIVANILSNEGLMVATNSAYLEVSNDGERTWTNSGIVRADSGTVALSEGSVLNQGTFEARHGGSFFARRAVTLNNGGTLLMDPKATSRWRVCSTNSRLGD